MLFAARGSGPAFYHMILALEDLAKVELVNRDLMGGDGNMRREDTPGF